MNTFRSKFYQLNHLPKRQQYVVLMRDLARYKTSVVKTQCPAEQLFIAKRANVYYITNCQDYRKDLVGSGNFSYEKFKN